MRAAYSTAAGVAQAAAASTDTAFARATVRAVTVTKTQCLVEFEVSVDGSGQLATSVKGWPDRTTSMGSVVVMLRRKKRQKLKAEIELGGNAWPAGDLRS
jgi:hypothetical protein